MSFFYLNFVSCRWILLTLGEKCLILNKKEWSIFLLLQEFYHLYKNYWFNDVNETYFEYTILFIFEPFFLSYDF